MRLVFLISVTLAGWTSRVLGLQPTLLVCAGLLAAVGLFAMVWGRRAAGGPRTS